MKTLRERLALAMRGPPPISQVELSRAVGVSQPSVNDWLSGKTKSIRGPALVTVATKLHVAPEWLAAGKGPMRGNFPPLSQSLTLDRATLIDAYVLLRQLYTARDELQVFDPIPPPELIAEAYEIAAKQRAGLPANLIGLAVRFGELSAKRK